MKLVQPIRDKEQINLVKGFLKETSQRDYIIFLVGINTGLRISDLLNLTVGQVELNRIQVKEKKTGKPRNFKISKEVRIQLCDYIKTLKATDKEDYLFLNYKGDRISRQHIWKVLKKAGDEFGIENIGTHTIRKTFGYWHYKMNNNIALLQLILNHDNPMTTLKYIGIEQDHIDESMVSMNL
jgi:integrase